MKKGVQKRMYRQSPKGTGNSVVFCGSQGCCPKGEFTSSGDLKISDNGVEITFSPDQVEGLRQFLADMLKKTQ